MEEKLDLQHINEIDMECADCEDEDFGGPINNSDLDVFIDKKISASVNNNGFLEINKNFNSNEEVPTYNEIDMETEFSEDDDDDSFSNIKTELPKSTSGIKTGIILDFSDDDDEEFLKESKQAIEEEEDLSNKELISEDSIQEKKVKKSFGEVEDDYWKQLQKKHAKTNTKHSMSFYQGHGHFCGDPEQEIADFNKGFAADGNSTPAASISASGAAGGDGGCCEEIKQDKNYNKLFENLLLITGFDLDKNEDNTFTLKDTCNLNPDCICKDKEEAILSLNPYINDCFICPLQVNTGEKFNTCKEWCDWYTPEMEQKFPKCKQDIEYCDLIANHINDINL